MDRQLLGSCHFTVGLICIKFRKLKSGVCQLITMPRLNFTISIFSLRKWLVTWYPSLTRVNTELRRTQRQSRNKLYYKNRSNDVSWGKLSMYNYLWLWRASGVLNKRSLYSLLLCFLCKMKPDLRALCSVFLLSTYGSGATLSFGRIRGWGSCCMIESGRRDNFSVLRRHRTRLHRQQVTDHVARKERCWKHTPLWLTLVSSSSLSLSCPYVDLFLLLMSFFPSVVMSWSEGCLFPGYVLFYVMLHPVF